jgi:hypothetical protein
MNLNYNFKYKLTIYDNITLDIQTIIYNFLTERNYIFNTNNFGNFNVTYDFNKYFNIIAQLVNNDTVINIKSNYAIDNIFVDLDKYIINFIKNINYNNNKLSYIFNEIKNKLFNFEKKYNSFELLEIIIDNNINSNSNLDLNNFDDIV